MRTFTFFFGSMLSELALKHTDNLSRTLQHVSMSAAEGQQVALMTIATLNSICNYGQFDLFWDLAILKAKELGVGEPQLPRRRKVPPRLDDGSSSGEFPSTAKAHFKQAFFEATDQLCPGTVRPARLQGLPIT